MGEERGVGQGRAGSANPIPFYNSSHFICKFASAMRRDAMRFRQFRVRVSMKNTSRISFVNLLSNAKVHQRAPNRVLKSDLTKN